MPTTPSQRHSELSRRGPLSALARMLWGVLVVTMTPLLTVGCAAPPNVENTQPISAASYGEYFDAAVAVLRDQGFTIDRSDYRFGTIKTQPVGSPTAFEPWRQDNSTGSQIARSTLNDLRRRVTVQLEPLQGDANADSVASDYQLAVQVVLERRQDPARYLTGSTRNQAIVRAYNATPAEVREHGIDGQYWVAVERDTQMERELMADILVRAMEQQQVAEVSQ